MSDDQFPIHLEIEDLGDAVAIHFALTKLIAIDEHYCHQLLQLHGAGADAVFDAHRRDENNEFHELARIHQIAPALRRQLEQLNEKKIF